MTLILLICDSVDIFASVVIKVIQTSSVFDCSIIERQILDYNLKKNHYRFKGKKWHTNV